MKTKTILGALALGGVAFYLYKRSKAGKSLNPFAKTSSFTGDDGFFNSADGGGFTRAIKYKIVPPPNFSMTIPNQNFSSLDALWRNPNTYKLNDGYLCDQVSSGQIQTNLPCIPKQDKREGLKFGTEIIGTNIVKETFFNPRWNTLLKNGVVKMSGRGKYYIPADFLQVVEQ